MNTKFADGFLWGLLVMLLLSTSVTFALNRRVLHDCLSNSKAIINDVNITCSINGTNNILIVLPTQ